MQTILGSVAAQYKFQSSPYSLDVLPLSGVDDGSQTIRDAKGRLTQTNQILEGILKAPYGITSVLRTQLEDVRFHVINGLMLIDTALRLGNVPAQPALDVDGLFTAIDNHKLAVERARGAWKAWLADAHAQQTTADPPLPAKQRRARGSNAVAGYLGDDVVPKQSMTPYLIAGGAAVLLYLLTR